MPKNQKGCHDAIYNLAQGAVATMQGIGASLSGLAAGLIVDRFGYSAGFLTFGAAACVALGALVLAMPETDRGSVRNGYAAGGAGAAPHG